MNIREKEIRNLYSEDYSLYVAMAVSNAFYELAEKRGVTPENWIKFNALLQDYFQVLFASDNKACYETLVALYVYAGSDDEVEQKEALSMVARKSIFTCIA